MAKDPTDARLKDSYPSLAISPANCLLSLGRSFCTTLKAFSYISLSPGVNTFPAVLFRKAESIPTELIALPEVI